jgi:short-subunit dehydrogenase
MSSLVGKIILLTGASRGIGPVVAECLSRQGAILALSARSEEGLRAVAGPLEGAQVFTADLSREADCSRLVAEVLAKLGRIDILVNNAGLETEDPYLRLPWQDIRRTVEVSLLAPMALAHLVLPQMVERGQGHIVNIASVGGKFGIAYGATYCGTKAGVAEWTRGLRQELAGTGVGFSTIFPTYVTDVGMFAKFGIRAHWMSGSCTPTQVAEAVLDAIERRRVETIVGPWTLRWSFAAAQLFPGLLDRLSRLLGVVDFQRRKVGA